MQDLSAVHSLVQYQQYATPDKVVIQSNTNPSSIQQHIRPVYIRGFQSEECGKDEDTPNMNLKLMSQMSCSEDRDSSDKSQQEWPQIKSIVNKISKIQTTLSNERKISRELVKKVRIYQGKIRMYEEEINRYISQLSQQEAKQQDLLDRVRELEETAQSREQEISQLKQNWSQIQIVQMRKVAQMQQKIKKGTIEQNSLADRLRKFNCQLQKERVLNRELKSQMLDKIQRMQSNKQSYLIQEIENMKIIIETSKDQRQLNFLEDIEQLNKRIYQLQEEVKKKNIQINLMQRKKQQAVTEALEKKDQQVKTQRSLFKTLNDKFSKLQADFKNLKKQNSQIARVNKIFQAERAIQEEVSLQLSPQKC